MPKMGESITEGTVIAWHKQVGDTVDMDEVLLEIGTDKVDTEVPSPAAGKLIRIAVPEGETVDVGTVIAVLETDVTASVAAPAPAAPVAAPAPPPVQAAPPAPAPPPAPAAPKVSAGGPVVQVTMPKMGESITEGTVIAWHKKVGDTVDMDEVLLEIGTDKVDTEVPSPAAGTLVAIKVSEGESVDVGTVIAEIAQGSVVVEDVAPAPAPAPVAVPAAPTPAPVAETPAEPAGPIDRKGPSGRFYSPLVREIAKQEGLSMEELERVPGHGRDGRVSKEDLIAFLAQRSSAPAAPAAAPAPTPAPVAVQAPAAAPKPAPRPAPVAPTVLGDRVEVIEMDRMRRIIAEHMVRSKSISAHVTSFAEIDVTNVVRHRERNKDRVQSREGIKLTYTPYFIHAAIEALRDHPLLNASVEDTRILVKKDFHIGMAVAIGSTGLMAPIIRDAGNKNLIGLARSAADLANRARSKQLQPDELQGGTFTVTNVGSLGSLMGTPIINQPQVGILATGAIKKKPVVLETPHGDVIAIRHMMFVSLSYDHRIIDGAMGASFLQRYTAVLEGFDPEGDL